ncbi:MAG: hypothetical protein CM1200mP10_16410 [Candidatus Neomarinimicrobiota bacterium]|nr:MAG: hypothetical protein CM1200mP10_16410 [Candidatus Neomarinimicrobiota bacterium]
MSDGSEAGAWWKAGMYLSIGDDTLDVMLVQQQISCCFKCRGSVTCRRCFLLLGLTAEQINVVGDEPRLQRGI